jgi:c-di-GMP-binding flagellar brake protein YcgR
MTHFYESEKREFVRVGVAVPVKYRFLSQSPDVVVPGGYLQGETQNISAGGILLIGPIPSREIMSDLLIRRVLVGVRVFLPGEEKPVEALARVAWLEAINEKESTCSLGLAFKEITSVAQDVLFRFIIGSRLA